ncbi:hypothetical protein [Dongia mobilis]|uniref:hypothetical protein n=1 Tax=Dongia sp. TaxID=1977262 RepID=UPI0026F1D6C2
MASSISCPLEALLPHHSPLIGLKVNKEGALFVDSMLQLQQETSAATLRVYFPTQAQWLTEAEPLQHPHIVQEPFHQMIELGRLLGKFASRDSHTTRRLIAGPRRVADDGDVLRHLFRPLGCFLDIARDLARRRRLLLDRRGDGRRYFVAALDRLRDLLDCKRRSNNPSLKRPDNLVAPE